MFGIDRRMHVIASGLGICILSELFISQHQVPSSWNRVRLKLDVGRHMANIGNNNTRGSNRLLIPFLRGEA